MPQGSVLSAVASVTHHALFSDDINIYATDKCELSVLCAIATRTHCIEVVVPTLEHKDQ
jgi:hypothetical protein